jgi:hypothetical protein
MGTKGDSRELKGSAREAQRRCLGVQGRLKGGAREAHRGCKGGSKGARALEGGAREAQRQCKGGSKEVLRG